MDRNDLIKENAADDAEGMESLCSQKLVSNPQILPCNVLPLGGGTLFFGT